VRGLVAQLSRKDFEVTALCVGWQDDEVTRFIKQHADISIEVPRHLPSARRLIAEQHLDVLFYADIGMDPITRGLALSRLAPVQCVTWGHPDTTGMDTIDYFISAEDLETEEGDQYYTETLVRLKNPWIYYYRPETPASRKTRQDYGLTKDDHIYACPQTLFKFHPEFDPLLAAILRGDPQGRLLLLEGHDPHWTELLMERFRATMPDVLGRIRFLPFQRRQDYLSLLEMADVLLDPIHFTGGNSSYEAFAVGTPVVTLPSRFLRGRITLALYKQMRVLDCVAQSPEDYVKKALQLGMDPDYRQAMRQRILAANSVLFENPKGLRELEQFLLQAVAGKKL